VEICPDEMETALIMQSPSRTCPTLRRRGMGNRKKNLNAKEFERMGLAERKMVRSPVEDTGSGNPKKSLSLRKERLYFEDVTIKSRI